MPQVANEEHRELMDVVDELIDRGENDITSIAELGRKMSVIEPRRNAESWRKELRRFRKVNAKEVYIAIIARAFNIDRDVLPPAKARTSLAEVDRRLAAIEAAVGLVEDGETVGSLLYELAEKLADLSTRVQELEGTSHHGFGGAAPMKTP